MTMNYQLNRGDVQLYIASWGEKPKVNILAYLNFAKKKKKTYKMNLECFFFKFQWKKFKYFKKTLQKQLILMFKVFFFQILNTASTIYNLM